MTSETCIQPSQRATQRTIFQTLRPNARYLIELLTCCPGIQLPLNPEMDVWDLTRCVLEFLDPHDGCAVYLNRLQSWQRSLDSLISIYSASPSRM